MPFALTSVGLLLIITGFQDTYKQFGAEVAGDFTGSNNFFYWMLAIILVGSLGYIKPLEGFSRAFMILILLVLILDSQSGVAQGITAFSNLTSGLASGTSTADTEIGAPILGSSGGGGSGSGGGGLSLGTIASVASVAGDFGF